MGKKLIILGILLVGINSVSAYIDPGTAGTIIGGSIWPFIVGIVSAIGAIFGKYLIKPIKVFFKSLFGKKEGKEDNYNKK